MAKPKQLPHHQLFRTWADYRKALLEAGRLYWEAEGRLQPKAGRPSKFERCYRAIRKEIDPAFEQGTCKFGIDGETPLINGQPLTQGAVGRMIRKHEPTFRQEVRRKYARMIYLCFKYDDLDNLENLSPRDAAFLKKYLPSQFKNR